MDIKNREDFVSAIQNGPYAWPGGYPLMFITNHGFLDFRTAKKHFHAICKCFCRPDRRKTKWERQYLPTSVDVNWEEPNLICCVSDKRIESAYTEECAGCACSADDRELNHCRECGNVNCSECSSYNEELEQEICTKCQKEPHISVGE